MRRFHSYGSIDTEEHYYAPRKELIEKVYFMKHNSLEQSDETNQNNESPLKFGHKVCDLCEKLNIKSKISRITKNVDKPIEPGFLHQAWRYGKQLDKDEETVCIEEFQRILEELNRKLM